MKKFLFVLLTSFFVSMLNYGYAEESKTSNTTLNEKNTQSIDSINGEIKKLQAKYEITKSAKDKKNISAKISTLKKQLDKLNKDRVTGSVSSAPCPGLGCTSEAGTTSSKKKPTPTPTPTHRTELWDIFIGAAIKDEIDGLQAKYNQTKDAKEKESINNKIAELEKNLEGLIKKEIEGLKAKYNQTKDAKEKDSITKRIDELTRKLESSSRAPTQSKPKTEQAPTTGSKQSDNNTEVNAIKNEIESLKAKYDQTKDAREKDSITKRIDELTRKLQSLVN